MSDQNSDDNIDKASEATAAVDDPGKSPTGEDGTPAAAPAVDQRADVPYDVAFRLGVYYDVEKRRYGVRCDELGDLEVSGATRAEALSEGEAMLESKIAAFAVKGETLPKPFDFERPVDYSGHLELEISRSLHRDLAVAARRERLAVEKLCVEMLARGVEARNRGFRSDRPADDRPARDRRDNDPDRGKRGMSRDRYQHVMEDKAAFIEYVRNMDQGNASGGNRGGRGGGNERGGGGGRNWRNR